MKDQVTVYKILEWAVALDTGAPTLVQKLKINTVLTTLQIYGTISDVEAEELGVALKTKTSLTTLHIKEWLITAAAAEAGRRPSVRLSGLPMDSRWPKPVRDELRGAAPKPKWRSFGSPADVAAAQRHLRCAHQNGWYTIYKHKSSIQ